MVEPRAIAKSPSAPRIFDGIPLARFGTREEIAYAAVFVSSPAASYRDLGKQEGS